MHGDRYSNNATIQLDNDRPVLSFANTGGAKKRNEIDLQTKHENVTFFYHHFRIVNIRYINSQPRRTVVSTINCA